MTAGDRSPKLGFRFITMTLSDYIESLTVTQGTGAGSTFRLFPWERRFLRGAFADDAQESALSIGRGNGKTALVSAIGCACLDGPLAAPRAEVVIVASSLDQARIAGGHVLAMLPGGHDPRRFRVWDSTNKFEILNRSNGVRLKCAGSDPRRAHGLAPVLVIADEPAQYEPNKSARMIAALRTSLGKIPNSRLIALGTRPDDSEHWFQKLLDGGRGFSFVLFGAS